MHALSWASCIFLTCDFTSIAVHMAQYICRRHLIPAGGGKTASNDKTLSLRDCVCVTVYSFCNDLNIASEL